MKTLVFFPWLETSGEGQIGDFRLLEYRRGELPSGQGTTLQQEIDSVTEPYCSQAQRPINRATILAIGKGEINRELDDVETNAVFAFAELLAMAGLATRRFFSQFEYSNRDLFQIVVRRYHGVGGGAAFASRRRDGISTAYVSKQALLIQRPLHIHAPLKVQFDIPILNALFQAQTELEPEKWNSYYESLVNYEVANRDSPDLTLQTEAVLTIGAFERLFDLQRGKEGELAEAFVKTFRPSEELPMSDCHRFSCEEGQAALEKVGPVRNLWIRDFFRLRGNLAHGAITPRYISHWSLEEHLLLASYVFSVLLKSRLMEDGFYKLTDSDRDDIDVFERLACAELFPRAGTEAAEEADREFPWNQVRGNFLFKRIFQRLNAKDDNRDYATDGTKRDR